MSLRFNINTDVNESEFEDIAQYYEITEQQVIYDLLGEIIILNRYDDLDMLFRRIVDVATCCWNIHYGKNNDVLQHTLIKIKNNLENDVTYQLPLNKLMISFPFIKAAKEYIEYINLDDIIIHGDILTKKMRCDMQDNLVKILKKFGNTLDEINEIIADVALELKELIIIFSKADMRIYSAETLFLDQYQRSKIIREINNTEYSANMQANEIVEENRNKMKLLFQEMNNIRDEYGRMNPFFEADNITRVIKPKQIEEVYINFAQIPDGSRDGYLVDIIMNGNGTNRGYSTIPIFYAGAIAARVPDIYNEDFMGSAGYFSRNLMILSYGTLSRTVFDCGSKNYVKITIKEETMHMWHGRYYKEFKGSPIMKVFNKDDKSLIGKTLFFRSPCKCNLNEDVCHVCHGSAALKVGNLAAGFIYTTEIVTSRIGNNVLSVKHILKADAEPVIFTGDFDTYFVIESSSVIPKDEKRFDIYIKENYSDDILNGLTLYIGKDMIPIGITNYASINIPQDILDQAKEVTIDEETYLKISSYKIIDNGGILCNITPISISSLAVYMNIMKMFENDVVKFEHIDDAVDRLTDMLAEVMPVLAVHGEIMLSKLLRRKDNILLRPNFLEEDAEYQIIRLKSALQNSEAVTVGLAFEQPKHHTMSSIVEKRNKIQRVGQSAFADFMFGEGRI